MNMRKLMVILFALVALSASAFAAVICDSVIVCKFTGQIGDLDCSGRECPLIFGLSDTPGEVVPLSVVLGPGHFCHALDFKNPLVVPVLFSEEGIGGVILTFSEDPPPGTEYSLGAFFPGCELGGCGSFTAGTSMGDCGGVGARPFDL